ncbi:MAG: phosphatase PAP2 family protein [Ignavibacteriae bacterium]|nr:phosphatase PAP2 family protein [Ignavibacteriota bacterium]
MLQAIHDWYPVPGIFLLFKEVHVIIQSLGGNDWDDLFIAADRWMFGTDPTVWVTQISSPLLTEILQVAYFSYYFLMIALGIELYAKDDKRQFFYTLFTIFYGFFLSYFGYLAFPAVGPRFTLHNFDTLNDELPGLVFTNALRDFINAGESIPKGAVNPLALAQRDAFPSGHTQMTLIVMFFAAKYQLKSRHILQLLGCLLIISTVYLRYHYVIDLLGGVVFMWFTIWSAPRLFHWWKKKQAVATL